MAQNAQQENKELSDLRKSAGRVNWGEYSKMTGQPIPKDVGPGKSYKPSPEALKARHASKKIGRVNASEYAALTAKQPKRKAALRKRVATK
ncbi:MAG: hypothetical protein ABR865_15565 [Terracidiphilus sp.]|jgi:hypothetical protein